MTHKRIDTPDTHKQSALNYILDFRLHCITDDDKNYYNMCTQHVKFSDGRQPKHTTIKWAVTSYLDAQIM